MSPLSFCASPYRYQRHLTREVTVGDPARGGVIIGGAHPPVAQSMITCDTLDTAECVRQTLELAAAGSQLVRITAPTVRDAANLQTIVAELHRQGCFTPIVADIHFKPEAALEAARWVEKIRVNPGNYADKKKFATRDYTDQDYAGELERIEEQFSPLVRLCLERGRAMRIGANHGSLSDRIMNRYGDTPMGMVESALEFARICRALGYHNFLFSMKASNPKIMIECYRLLAAKLDALGPDWNYPLHLGVTEAGEGEDGRIKSAIGIGSLLCDGLGDTLRVSLTEDSPNELPVCRALVAETLVLAPAGRPASGPEPAPSFDPFTFRRRASCELAVAPGIRCGGQQPIRVVVSKAAFAALQSAPHADIRPEAALESLAAHAVDPSQPFDLPSSPAIITVRDGTPLPALAAFRLLAARLQERQCNFPILLKDTLIPGPAPLPRETALLRASVVLGALLADGIGDAIYLRSEADPAAGLMLAYNILQAAGCRSFKTDYVACPSCGRTLFNLQTVTARIKARTQHLKGVKIAIMGCIVNGPGEMADADFGYVGGAPAKINLYVGKTAVRFNIPEDEAVDRLVDLIREHGKWVEPAEKPAQP